MPLSGWLYNPSYFENVVLFVGSLIAMINDMRCSPPPFLVIILVYHFVF